MPFGIPERVPDPKPLVDVIATSTGDIVATVSALTDDLGQSLVTSDQLLQLVSSAVASKLRGAQGASSRNINDVLAQLASALQSAQSVSGGELASVVSAAGGQDSIDAADVDALPAIGTSATPPSAGATLPGTSALDADEGDWQVSTDIIGEEGQQHVEVITATLPAPTKATPDTLGTFPDRQIAAPPMPAVPPVVHSSWFDRFSATRAWLIEYGKVALSRSVDHMDEEFTRQLAQVASQFVKADDTMDFARSRMAMSMNHANLIAIAARWQETVVATLAEGSRNVLYMLVARDILRMLASVNTSISGEFAGSMNVGVSIGVGK